MSFPTYPSYKEVPIPWVHSIPEHWEWKPVLGAARERDEDNKGMKEDNLLSLSYGKIVTKDINTSDGLLPESFETYQIVRPGDIVLRLTDLQNDKRSLRSALVTQTGIITSAYLALEAKGINSKYLGYLLRSYDVSKVFYSMGGGLRQSMKYGDIKRMPLVIPTKTEQLAITSFLDRETAKIDALIAEQQRLIELLQEKRQAVISHAVTKGLNPNAPMKDSGVKWLGEVPEHWEVRQLNKLITKITNGYVGPTREILRDEGVRYLQSLHIKNNQIVFDSPYYVSEEWSHSKSKSILQEGDVLVVQTGDIGQSAVVTREFVGCNCHALIIISPVVDALSGDWLSWALNSSYGKETLLSIQTGALHPHLNCGNVKFIQVPVPPLGEQSEICQFIKTKLKENEELVASVSDSIRLMSERRSALISAAVTGQIDVRGLVPEAAEQ